ncbi:MAG: hypothetical protein ACOCYO_10605 [Bacteroidota bacterium]
MKKRITSMAIVLTLFTYFYEVQANQNFCPGQEINMNTDLALHVNHIDNAPEESTTTGPSAGKDSELSFSVNSARKEMNKELEEINTAMIRRHQLGEEIAKRLHLFEKLYTYESKSPGALSSRQIIEKPVIYNSINQIEKYFKKQVRKDQIAKANAADDFKSILEKALLLYYEDTKELESILSNRESIEKQITLFNNISLH